MRAALDAEEAATDAETAAASPLEFSTDGVEWSDSITTAARTNESGEAA